MAALSSASQAEAKPK
ncbi:hypothetical protein A2U01_0077509, partial [Trifolium medium]|nr:hypothetical protein [Trifolium medium]